MTSPSPNFLTCPIELELPPGSPMPLLPLPRTSRRRSWKFGAIFLIVMIAVFLPLLSGMVVVAYGTVTLRAAVRSAYDHALHGRYAEAQAKLVEAGAMVETLQTGFHLTAFWHSAPWVGRELGDLEQASIAGQATLASAQEFVSIVSTMQEAVQASTHSFHDLPLEDRQALLVKVTQAMSDLRVVRDKLGISLDLWQRVPSSTVTVPLTQFKHRLDQLISFSDVALPLFASREEKRYLLLLQNADELRPTGGFLGVIGVLHLHAGQIKSLDFQDVYAIDGPVQEIWRDVPPEILRRELGVKAWFLRDRNWSPDFPSSAEAIIDTYTRERMLVASSTIPIIDGVIAFEPEVFRRLLEFTGPLTVDGKTFDAGNFFDQLQYDVEIGYREGDKTSRERKDIVSHVGDALMSVLASQPLSRFPTLLETILTSLDEKDVLLYTRDTKALALLDDYRWTGRTLPTPTDYVWVVDANLAAFKTDGVMKKDITYQLDATHPDQVTATVMLTYQHTHPVFDWRYTRYRDYVRVYVPEGSELISSEGAMKSDITKTGGRVVPGQVDLMNDLGKTVFGAFWSIEPGKTGELKFTYRLPSSVADAVRAGTYQLQVQKQPGSRARLTTDLAFGKKLMQAVPAEEEKEWGDDHYRSSIDLIHDQLIQLKF
ncbi:DUF4012 domain-containing protein [Candidatus Uhrbacteria bacterium]|nr:DUF4012 domain-containing protein [Candidatus Uhrbacteria bacterium]